ncbi:hypothetical protein [Kribbella qitaiheensis]|uniref:hypothetical protein n=1 Tax=Kribbella qitaiheensis TaxID=1544730 RepID=UPI0016280358|nr:hypothetical protein [Kribbella qitaiheensis]
MSADYASKSSRDEAHRPATETDALAEQVNESDGDGNLISTTDADGNKMLVTGRASMEA